MVLMAVLGLLLIIGVALTVWWGGRAYEIWKPDSDLEPPSRKVAALRYLRGVAIALVGGMWAGVLVTGPSMRLIMRLLAVTAGDGAQGRITEAEQVVGKITFDGTLGLYIFGGILPGLLSGALYVLFRRLLPAGRLGGLTFGLLHLVIAATRVDPLRPDNVDFDLVGPPWLALATFGLATIVHGMAVVAIANRYSAALPPRSNSAAGRARAFAPVVIPALFLIPGVFLLVFIVLGLGFAVLTSQIPRVMDSMRSPLVVAGGRVVLALVALLLLPGAVSDLRDIVVRA